MGEWRSLQSFQSVLTARCGLLEVGLAQKIELGRSKPSETSFKVSLGPTEVVSVSLDYKATVRDLLRTLDCDEGRLRIGDRLGAPQETLLDLGVDIGLPVSLERRLMVRAKLPPPLPCLSVRVWPSDTLAQLKAKVEAEAGHTVRSFMCDGEAVEAWRCNVHDLGLRDGEELETVLLGECSVSFYFAVTEVFSTIFSVHFVDEDLSNLVKSVSSISKSIYIYCINTKF